MKTEALDKKVTFGMFVKNIQNKLKSIMAKSISAEDKLNLILVEMEKDVQEKRITARNTRSKMVALADPETAQLEPLERLRVKRQKLVELGAKVLKEKETAQAENKTEVVSQKEKELAKITKEIKALTPSLNSLENTYETIKEAYELALENYKVSESAYQHAKENGSTLLFAIKAHQDALQMKDNAKNSGSTIDASFLNDLENELSKSQRELRSDKELDKEIKSPEESLLDHIEATEVDNSILEEFKSVNK